MCIIYCLYVSAYKLTQYNIILAKCKASHKWKEKANRSSTPRIIAMV